MAYDNFKPIIWSKYIQKQLMAECILVDDCYSKFEGEAKKGQKVKIIGLGKPTIGDYTGKPIGTPETIEDSSVYLEIDQAKFFNFQVDDVDQAQAQEGLMELYMDEAVKEMAVVRDKYVAEMAKNAGGKSGSVKISTAKEAKTAIDKGLRYLRENNVKATDDVTIVVPYWFYQIFKDNLIELKTNNDELIKKGIVGMYDNCKFKYSNNLFNDGTDTYAMIKTKKAVAFASGIDETEAYRPEQLFSDAVKGLNTFGAKVVRPKEFYALTIHE